eukprot:COSAG05_NODE_559_length_8689_cov_212.699418_4_plen_167_part_00
MARIWTLFIDAMECGRRDRTISAPDAVLGVLNREKRGEMLMSVQRNLKEQLQHAASLLGPSGGDVWKCVQQIARKFGFKPNHTTERGPRMLDGTRPRQFATVTLVMELAHFVDAWSLYDARCNPARFTQKPQRRLEIYWLGFSLAGADLVQDLQPLSLRLSGRLLL